MRKYLTLCLGLGLAGILAFSACETTNVYPNTSKSFIYSINTNQWADHEFWISHTINLPELTDYCADYTVTLFSDLTRKVTMQNLFHDGGFSYTGVSQAVIDEMISK